MAPTSSEIITPNNAKILIAADEAEQKNGPADEEAGSHFVESEAEVGAASGRRVRAF